MNPNKSIRGIMTTDLVTVKPDDAITRIRSIFEKHDFHHLPVVEQGQDLIGIISKEDYYKIYDVLFLNSNGNTKKEEAYATVVAKNIMTKYPMCLHPEDSIGLAADVFLANKFHALPVVEDGQLTGIVTAHDLLSYGFKSIRKPMETEEFSE